MSVPSFIHFTGASLALAVALLGLALNRGRLLVKALALGLVLLGLMDACWGIAALLPESTARAVWIELGMAAQILLPVPWLFFSLGFGRGNWRVFFERWKAGLCLAAAAAGAFVVLLSTPHFWSLEEDGAAALGWAGRIYYICFLAVSALILTNLERTVWSATWETRGQIRAGALGVAGLFGYLVYLAGQAILTGRMPGELEVTTTLVGVASTAFLGYSLMRERFPEARIAVSENVVYGSASLLLVGLYLTALGLVSMLAMPQGWVLVAQGLLAFLSILLLAWLFLEASLRARIKRLIGRHLFVRRHDFREHWMRVTERLRGETETQVISERLLEYIQAIFGPRAGSVWLLGDAKRAFARSASIGEEEGLPRVASLADLAAFLLQQKDTIEVATMRQAREWNSVAEASREFLKATKAVCCVPLLSGERLIGILVLGERSGREPYSAEDRQLLRVICLHAGSQIENARLLEAQAAVRETEALRTLSRFVVHDIKNLGSTLSLLVQNASKHIEKPAFQQEALRALGEVAGRLSHLTRSLHRFNGSFSVDPRPARLNEVVKSSLRSLEGALHSAVKLELGEVPPLYLDPEQVDSVLTNLALNADEAISAAGRGGEITIATRTNGTHAVLSVKDDGPGIPASFIADGLFSPFRTTKAEGLGIGLFQSKKIVEAHGGWIDVRSVEGAGAEFRVCLPLGARSEEA